METGDRVEPEGKAMGFAAWADRLARWAASMSRKPGVTIQWAYERGGAAAAGEVERIGEELGEPLPDELAKFFGEAGRRVCFRYRWEADECRKGLGGCGLSDAESLWGGLDVSLEALPGLRREVKELMRDKYVEGIGMEEERDFWMESLPLMRLENGDYLAVGTGDGSRGEIRYLSHDSAGEVLADSLLEWLQEWERLGYVGPEIWMLEPFIDPQTARLDAGGPKALKLQELLKVASSA